MNTKRVSQATQAAQARLVKSAAHDEQYFRDRKIKEAENLAKTRALRALRLAKEAQERASKDQAGRTD